MNQRPALSRRRLPWCTGTFAAIAALVAPAAAQVAAPAVPPASTQVPASPVPPAPVPVIPVPPVAPSVPLPTLSAVQRQQLATLIADDELAQGLRLTRRTDLDTLDSAAMVRAALDHARAVHAGRLMPEDFQKDWGVRPTTYDPLPAFAEAVSRDRLSSWLRSLPPPYQGYDTLVAGLARYRAIADKGGWGTLTATPAFGSRGADVARLRERLALEDPQAPSSGDTFDAALLEAVRRAQRRYGLNPAGQVGAQTLAALNVPVERRMRQIMANLERWRWLPPELDKKRVQVNIAAAVLTVFDGDEPVMSMRAVTGRPGNETPMLISKINSIVLNPPWNVPTSIATKELWPKEKASPGYLKRNGFRVIDTGNGGKRLQQSSEKSALGRYKFDFPNDFAVYLHDTPARSGFSRFDRLSSHGCVRLEKPADLARLMLRDTPEWPPETIDSTVAAGKTVRAAMATPVSVYLLYWTAFASPSGQVGFREDPYSWDARLAASVERRSAVQVQVAAR
jgi:L,D-transpeptidase YcbB